MIISIFVISSNRKRPVNRVFFLMTLVNSIWSLAYWRWLSVYDDATLALFWVRVLSIGSMLTSIFYLHWVLVLLELKRNKTLIFYYLISIYYFLFSFSDYFVSGVRPIIGFSFWPTPGPVYNLYFITHYLILVPYATYLLYTHYRSSVGVRKSQIGFAFWGALIGFTGGGTNFPLWYGIELPPFGNFLVLIYVISFAIAILKFRLMGIRTIMSKIYTYFLIATYAYSFFYLVIFIEEALFGSIYETQSLIIAPVFTLIFAVLFLPLFKKIQKSSDVLFFKGYNSRSILKDMSLRLNSVINLDQLLKALVDEFKRVLATEDVDVFIFKSTDISRKACLSILKNKDKTLPMGGSICKRLLKDRSIIIRDELTDDNESLIKDLDKLGAKIVAPLLIHQKTIGLVVLGEKIEQDAYTKEDVDFLQIISSQAAVAIENARLYKEVEDFNQTLQEKVDKQTKEIREKAEHLRKLMDMRSEFLDITSHQLRTPVTVIKGVLSMLEEGSIPPAKRKEFLRGAFEKSIKLGEIINDILRASEMDSERFELNLKPTDLNEVLKKIEEDKYRTSIRKNIALKFILPKKPLPPIMSDEKYIEQAIVNLINNSFQYTTKGSIIVSAEVSAAAVVIRVADTGIGIPKADIPKLFSKFARADNAVQAYTDGSGLGLFIIKQIVDATPGAKIEIEKTEIGKGTTFALTLPVAKVS